MEHPSTEFWPESAAVGPCSEHVIPAHPGRANSEYLRAAGRGGQPRFSSVNRAYFRTQTRAY